MQKQKSQFKGFLEKREETEVMPANKETLIRRFESTADTYEKKGKREWAYAKNGQGGEHYAKAKDAFDRAQRNRDKADALRRG